MNIKKFLKDNKGCPLTVPAIKQLLVKFIELLSEKGVVKDEVSNIKELSKETLDELQVGDIVQKITGNQKHAYMVTYKGEGAGEGICLTYCDAGYMETVSYDRSGNDWVYNSTDVVTIPSDDEIKVLAKEAIEATSEGTIQDALGLDAQGNLVKGSISAGTKLYKHLLATGGGNTLELISTDGNNWSGTGSTLDLSKIISAVQLCQAKIGNTNYWVGILGITASTPNISLFVVDTSSSTISKLTFATYSSTITDTVTEL